jgi:hypothetical protein
VKRYQVVGELIIDDLAPFNFDARIAYGIAHARAVATAMRLEPSVSIFEDGGYIVNGPLYRSVEIRTMDGEQAH